MKKFRNAFFGGYQKEEVDEYIEALISELERVKMNAGTGNVQESRELAEMKEQVQLERKEKDSLISQLEQMEAKIKSHSDDKEEEIQRLREKVSEYEKQDGSSEELEKTRELLKKEQREKEALMSRLEELEGKVRSGQDEKDEELQNMKAQLEKYKDSYDAFASVVSGARRDADKLVEEARENAESLLSKAKNDADKLLTSAQEDADKITLDARVEAKIYRDKVEKELKDKREADGKSYMLAKYRLMEYLNSLNKSQSQLIKTYNELGEIVKKMPIRIEDVFSDDPMELLPEADEKENVR